MHNCINSLHKIEGEGRGGGGCNEIGGAKIRGNIFMGHVCKYVYVWNGAVHKLQQKGVFLLFIGLILLPT